MQNSMKSEVRVGLGVIVVKDNKMLVGRRKGSHAAGLISFPGGHLDFGETLKACAYREIDEECGPNFHTVIRNCSELHDTDKVELFITNDIMPQYNKHYITIFMVADWLSGDPENMEPDKCDGWEWMTFDEISQCINNGQAAQWIPLHRLTAYRERIGV
jgi:8-oxo-dGTP diphosphatase